jgi:hypothetical protein
MSEHSSASPDSLDWLAFRYIAGEMTVAESTVFEERLGSDQAAREAVAAAVELVGALAACDPADLVKVEIGTSGADRVDLAGPSSTVRPSWRVMASWVVGGAIACLALAAVVDHWSGQRLRDLAKRSLARTAGMIERAPSHAVAGANGGTLDGTLDGPLDAGGDVASMAVRDQLARLWSEERAESAGELAADHEVESGDGIGADLASVDAPAWMIAAVAAKSGTLSDEAADAASEPAAAADAMPAPKTDAGAIP